MALEAVIFPQGPFNYGCKDFNYLGGGAGTWACIDDLAFQEDDDKTLLAFLDHNNIDQGFQSNWDSESPPVMQNVKEWDPNSSPEACTDDQSLTVVRSPPPREVQAPAAGTTTSRRKRKRTKINKNMEDIENQRMTHIAVERNRRKQMNEYLAVLRSLMPPSYVQRGDQASIVGGAINFVKELEQLLQSNEAHQRRKQQEPESCFPSSQPFAQFFIFPQYSRRAAQCSNTPAAENESMAQNQWAAPASAADIEVTMVESHANIKILSKKHPRQLLKMVAGFQTLGLTILHLNVTTVDQMVLYSVSVKVEEGCQLNTVDEIAAAVNQMLRRIQEEAAFT
ncbi:hypothetical protein I3842_16G031600 [Carya illinoinensis]|uniref:BHLH domain-containing protein n=1 Tax=Carya illinoinensis TaxID=32201 RepID=A0A922D8F8_CARIL|nr:hypothetical protein I3842_16G031600 [Carya illinoinensis]